MVDVFADAPEQLRAFVRDGRIAIMPSKRPRRRLLLDQVVQAFEPGRQYPETAVDEDFLSRTTDGIYWRSGGAVHV
jgi:hypothetical protein